MYAVERATILQPHFTVMLERATEITNFYHKAKNDSIYLKPAAHGYLLPSYHLFEIDLTNKIPEENAKPNPLSSGLNAFGPFYYH